MTSTMWPQRLLSERLYPSLSSTVRPIRTWSVVNCRAHFLNSHAFRPDWNHSYGFVLSGTKILSKDCFESCGDDGVSVSEALDSAVVPGRDLSNWNDIWEALWVISPTFHPMA